MSGEGYEVLDRSVLVCVGLWGSVGIRGGLWRSVIQLSNMDPGKK